jgi:hypothetical protein
MNQSRAAFGGWATILALALCPGGAVLWSAEPAPSGDVKPVLEIPDLIAFWTFGEPAGAARLSLVGETKFPLVEKNGPIERVAGGPFSGYAAKLSGKNYLALPYAKTGDLNIAGPEAQVTVVAFVKLDKVAKTSVAGMWSEGKGAHDDAGTRQYGLMVDMPAYGGTHNVTPHVSSEGGVTRRADGSKFPWCVDYACSVSRVPAKQWVSVGFTYDAKYLKAFYNGICEPRALKPEADKRTDRYFTQEGPDGGDRGMNPYYHGRGIFRFDPQAKYDPAKISPPDFLVGARYAGGSLLSEPMQGAIGGLAVFDRALSDDEMLRIHQAAKLDASRQP